MKVAWLFFSILALTSSKRPAREMEGGPPLRITIIYDNYPYDKNLQTDWGFSCYIEGLHRSILFDTGRSGQILLSNLRKLGLDPSKIDVVFLSHEHKDHTEGLDALLKEKPGIEVWAPDFFAAASKARIKESGAILREVQKSQRISEDARTTGIIEGWIKEQSLILETDKRVVVITGCAHPRIVKILAEVNQLIKKDIDLVLGGIHLAGFDRLYIKTTIREFRRFSVKKVGLCHCSGDEARRLFAEEYGTDFIETGVGKRIELA
jgi:7,8-dihydropterin-6-yl-methyl-4-(beta-D-ribofuranosyl)aminobenzene 5'-phosphate synthase